MKEILIKSAKHGDKVVLVDDEDFELVSKYRWIIQKGRTTYYAIHSSGWYYWNGKTVKRGITIRMHQLVLGVNPIRDGKRSKPIDHKDHNGLNNQKANIKVVTNSHNGANRKISRTHNTTGFKGVVMRTHTNGRTWRYVARIRVNNVLINLGSFNSGIQAAIAYNESAKKYFGEHAYLNQIGNV